MGCSASKVQNSTVSRGVYTESGKVLVEAAVQTEEDKALPGLQPNDGSHSNIASSTQIRVDTEYLDPAQKADVASNHLGIDDDMKHTELNKSTAATIGSSSGLLTGLSTSGVQLSHTSEEEQRAADAHNQNSSEFGVLSVQGQHSEAAQDTADASQASEQETVAKELASKNKTAEDDTKDNSDKTDENGTLSKRRNHQPFQITKSKSQLSIKKSSSKIDLSEYDHLTEGMTPPQKQEFTKVIKSYSQDQLALLNATEKVQLVEQGVVLVPPETVESAPSSNLVKRSDSSNNLKKSQSKEAIKRSESRTSIKKSTDELKRSESRNSMIKSASRDNIKRSDSRNSLKRTTSKDNLKKSDSRHSLRKFDSRDNIKRSDSRNDMTKDMAQTENSKTETAAAVDLENASKVEVLPSIAMRVPVPDIPADKLEQSPILTPKPLTETQVLASEKIDTETSAAVQESNAVTTQIDTTLKVHGSVKFSEEIEDKPSSDTHEELPKTPFPQALPADETELKAAETTVETQEPTETPADSASSNAPEQPRTVATQLALEESEQILKRSTSSKSVTFDENVSEIPASKPLTVSMIATKSKNNSKSDLNSSLSKSQQTRPKSALKERAASVSSVTDDVTTQTQIKPSLSKSSLKSSLKNVLPSLPVKTPSQVSVD